MTGKEVSLGIGTSTNYIRIVGVLEARKSFIAEVNAYPNRFTRQSSEDVISATNQSKVTPEGTIIVGRYLALAATAPSHLDDGTEYRTDVKGMMYRYAIHRSGYLVALSIFYRYRPSVTVYTELRPSVVPLSSGSIPHGQCHIFNKSSRKCSITYWVYIANQRGTTSVKVAKRIEVQLMAPGNREPAVAVQEPRNLRKPVIGICAKIIWGQWNICFNTSLILELGSNLIQKFQAFCIQARTTIKSPWFITIIVVGAL
ncbi:hypothetical protein B0J17DRAFT_632884 [Rhizoctonia solani]|nr:hypothetical protein B0J17DRAFT_632884 [Rhizoctonia solani]